MRSWARWAFFIILLAFAAPLPSPARAAFGDCASAEYRASFDPRFASIEYDCVERLRLSVSTSSGERRIRILHDLMADWIISSGEMAEFDRGVRAAAEAIGRLGGVDLEDVTILLADDLPPREDADTFSNIAAWTEFDNDGECRITVYLVGPASRPEYAAWLTAHEIFHCVQTANLRPEQMQTSSIGEGSGGDWWIEGSATWFAALALPDPAIMPDLAREFDSLSPTTPLNEMAYPAVSFFLWLAADVSPPGVMRFLEGMAGDRSAAAQHVAMAGALSQDDWLRFAQAYLDEEIRHPHGTPLTFSPERGETWQWSATRTQTLTLAPFVLARGAAAFDCGRWRTSVRPSAMHRARADGEPWADLPAEIDATSGSGGPYRVAAINASNARATLTIQGTMEAGCGSCADIAELDACLVGTWQLTAGGAAEWMRNQGMPGSYATSNETLTLRRDGTFVTGALQGRLQHEADGLRTDGRMSAQAGGRWSARGGVLNMCADMQALSGRTVLTTRDGRRAIVPVGSAPPTSSQLSYSCSGTTLSTQTPMPRGAAPMSSTYTRTTEEPAPPAR